MEQYGWIDIFSQCESARRGVYSH